MEKKIPSDEIQMIQRCDRLISIVTVSGIAFDISTDQERHKVDYEWMVGECQKNQLHRLVTMLVKLNAYFKETG